MPPPDPDRPVHVSGSPASTVQPTVLPDKPAPATPPPPLSQTALPATHQRSEGHVLKYRPDYHVLAPTQRADAPPVEPETPLAGQVLESLSGLQPAFSSSLHTTIF